MMLPICPAAADSPADCAIETIGTETAPNTTPNAMIDAPVRPLTDFETQFILFLRPFRRGKTLRFGALSIVSGEKFRFPGYNRITSL